MLFLLVVLHNTGHLLKSSCEVFTCSSPTGGHTSELLRLLSAFNLTKFSPRHYVIADTDSMSHKKVVAFETDRESSASQVT